MAAVGMAVAVSAWPAMAQFVEPDVRVLSVLEGTQVGDNFGWVGAALPDIDGDGVADFVIPAIGYEGVGRATVYSGRTQAVLNDVVGTGPAPFFGYSVSDAGDVDKDGVSDYIVGGGQVKVFSGRDHRLLYDFSTAGFGAAVSAAGDIDGDGHADVAVGVAFVDAGRVTVFSGRDGQVLWFRDGAVAGDRFGSALGLVGDVNKDGVPDLSVGAFGAGPFGGGLAFVVSGVDGSTIHQLEPVDAAEALVFGQFFASGASDVDGDGVPDVFVGDYAEGQGVRAGTGRAYIFSGFTGELLHVFTGFRPGDGLGPGRGIPDVNGDGHGDVIVAAYLNSDASTTAGAAYIFSGRSGALLRTMTATLAGDNFGVDALSLGDINDDRIPDFLVTAVGRSFAGTDTGRAYLIAGRRLPCVADVTGNRVVNRADFRRIRRAFGQSKQRFDLNGDGTVDVQDLIVARLDRGKCPPGVPKKRRRY
ncbi:MAG: dockerin type I domain-containing protein [Myxococcota bacterium]